MSNGARMSILEHLTELRERLLEAIIAVVIAMPVIVHQLFMFLAPGLEPQEKRYIFIGAPAAALCFAEGVVLAPLVLIPAAIPFMNVFFPGIVEQRYSIDCRIPFVSTVLLWSRIVFETPLVMYFMAKLGVVTHNTFTKARRGGGSHHHPHSRPVQYASEHDTRPYPLRAGHPARVLGATGESLPSHSYCGDILGSDGDYPRSSLGGT